VVITLLLQPRRLVKIGLRCLLYLTPWVLTVALKPALFVHQMELQWTRLVFHNNWLDSPAQAITGVFQEMGNPEPWGPSIHVAAVCVWILMFAAAVFGLGVPLVRQALAFRQGLSRNDTPNLIPAGAWVLGSVWLWYNKPEVWFNFFLHLSVWTFAGLALLSAWRMRGRLRIPALASLLALILAMTGIFAQLDVAQAIHMGASPSWHWETYREYVDCIDQHLVTLEKRLHPLTPFRVWCPTFPDITIELSRRHPKWELTRTNDFWDRADLAVQHGRDVEAVVVTESLTRSERNIDAKASDYPTINSAWMTWDAHFLNRLWKEPGWKSERYLCQRGRWQAFIFEKE
jgi:hypothetical protein